MGMFDDVRCQYPLPRPEIQDCWFQTKDFECEMSKYTLTADGRLIRSEHDSKWIDNAEDLFGGHYEKIEGTDREIEIPYHGDIVMYAFWPPKTPDTKPPLIQLRVRFTEGRVQWIRDEGDR